MQPTEGNPVSDQSQSSIQELRDAADRGREAAREAEELRRENAMLRAGVPTDTPLGAMFARAYDGKLDVDAVKAAWAEVAPAEAPPVEEQSEEQPPVEEHQQVEQTEQRRILTTGGAGETAGQTPPADPIQTGYGAFKEELAEGKSREEASAAVFGSILSAAAQGDERVIFSGWKPDQLPPS